MPAAELAPSPGRSRARPAAAASIWIAAAGAIAYAAFALQGGRHLALYAVGVAMGAVLLHTGFGFTGSLRRFVLERDGRALRAPLALIALTTLALAPALAIGEAFGQPLGPAAAPVAMQVALGAMLFGIGMQLGGGCGSGTLFSLGGGNGRMLVVVLFFCAGSFLASLHMGWWASLPSAAPIVLGELLGWPQAALLQVAAIMALWWGLGRTARPAALGSPASPLQSPSQSPSHSPSQSRPQLPSRSPSRSAMRSPLWIGAVALAALNLATLLLAGHPWSITWAYALWGAKAAVQLGWDPASSAFWQAPFQSAALSSGILDDVTSLMDIGLVLGAGGAALAAGRWSLRIDWRPGALLAAVLGGLLMGYGARIGFGCTIGALVSGIASTSVHGWLWFAAVLPGTWLGGRLRPHFGL